MLCYANGTSIIAVWNIVPLCIFDICVTNHRNPRVLCTKVGILLNTVNKLFCKLNTILIVNLCKYDRYVLLCLYTYILARYMCNLTTSRLCYALIIRPLRWPLIISYRLSGPFAMLVEPLVVNMLINITWLLFQSFK